MDAQYTPEQQMLMNSLFENTHVILDAEDEEGVSHYYTFGLCRWGVPELYICAPRYKPARGEPDHDPFQEILMELAPAHLTRRFHDGPLSFNALVHTETGELTAMEARTLRGPELYTAVTRLYDMYQDMVGYQADVLYEVGLVQVLWPDATNLAFSQLQPDEEMASQVIPPMMVH